jgi:outer membrane protein assembly factor BamB
MVGLLAVVGMWLLAVGAAWAAGASPDAVAREILDGAGIKGGLVVHLGCGDGKLTAALHASDSYLVHGLDSGRKNIARAREHIQALGLYGPVAVEQWRGRRLPYTDNLATLVVSERGGHASMAELLRVLAPNGVAYIKQGGKWTRTVKPRSPDIDEWTHYLHDATNNAVAHDTVVGPPRHLQWVGSPRWARHHDRMASLSALVSAGDRIFYIFDEGSHASVQLPSKWRLIARDAFNGTILWKREIDRWHPNLWPFKSGPAQPQRRLVAVGDALYVTLSLDAPLSALDGATGETVRTYEDTDATEEVIASEGVLFLLVTDSPMVYDDFRPERVGIGAERDRVARDWPWNGKPRRVMALDAATGKLLWEVEKTVVPLTLAADGRHVYFHDGERVVCLDRASGREKWQSEPVERRGVIPASFGPTLVVYEDVVLFAGGTRSMTALASETGKTLWSAEHARSGHYSPEDLLVLDGVVWSGATAGGGDSGEFVGLDLHTGEVRSRFETDSDIYFMHHRCHRGKATVRYLIPSRTGTEFVDPKTQHWDMNHWVRGGCIYGVMPCNGLLYATPHSCACYMESKLYGFNALAPASASRHLPANIPARNRLERGPAYGRPVEAAPADGDWPTYRGNTERSGFTKATVPADLTSAWETELGGRLSSVVVAEGKLLVSAVDRHMVHALDADSGEELWSYTAGGRVDSPPTVWQGRALFGSADGWVYCLRASDGELMWRFRAAPADRRLVAFEQIESVWPVPGSVMVLDPAANSGQAVAYCVAGRSMFLDGGLRLLMLDPRTGRKLSERILDERDPGTGENLQSHVVRQNMPVALPDVLASDGRHIYMRSQQFDLEGVRRHIAATDISPAAPTGGTHLFSPTGFVDGSWWHRSYWVYGKGFEEGAGGWPKAGKVMPGGHLLVVDDALVYGYGRKQEYYKWTTPVGYQLFAMNKLPKLLPRPRTETAQQAARRRRLPRVDLGYQWANDVPLQVRGIALAGGTLFIAGPPVVWDEDETFDRPDEPAVKAKLAQQNAALAGKSGALLWAVAASDGAKLAEHRLESPPAWDGMAAANGRLYISTTDGNVLCLAG